MATCTYPDANFPEGWREAFDKLVEAIAAYTAQGFCLNNDVIDLGHPDSVIVVTITEVMRFKRIEHTADVHAGRFTPNETRDWDDNANHDPTPV